MIGVTKMGKSSSKTKGIRLHGDGFIVNLWYFCCSYKIRWAKRWRDKFGVAILVIGWMLVPTTVVRDTTGGVGRSNTLFSFLSPLQLACGVFSCSIVWSFSDCCIFALDELGKWLSWLAIKMFIDVLVVASPLLVWGRNYLSVINSISNTILALNCAIVLVERSLNPLVCKFAVEEPSIRLSSVRTGSSSCLRWVSLIFSVFIQFFPARVVDAIFFMRNWASFCFNNVSFSFLPALNCVCADWMLKTMLKRHLTLSDVTWFALMMSSFPGQNSCILLQKLKTRKFVCYFLHFLSVFSFLCKFKTFEILMDKHGYLCHCLILYEFYFNQPLTFLWHHATFYPFPVG